jgi:hypothetical protein
VSDDMGRRHFIQFRTITKICLNDLPAIAVAGLSARMVVTPRREEGSRLMTWDAATSSRCSAARRNLCCVCARLDGLQVRPKRPIACCLQAEPHHLR